MVTFEFVKRVLARAWAWGCLLLNPPAKEAVFAAYNKLRQDYILHVCCTHFGQDPQDPAPLFGLKLLDVGCGPSTQIIAFLALAGAEVTAVDPDAGRLAEAKEEADAYGAPVTFVQGRLEDLVSEGKQYDIILTLDVLGYAQDLERFLWAEEKLLKAKGVVVLSAIRKVMKAWVVHILLSGYIFQRTPKRSRRWAGFYRIRDLRAVYLKKGMNMQAVQGLRFDAKTRQWVLHERPTTRYLATVTRI